VNNLLLSLSKCLNMREYAQLEIIAQKGSYCHKPSSGLIYKDWVFGFDTVCIWTLASYNS
jgi:hypothetical protein